MTKPFLKWVGGKHALLPELSVRLPRSYDTYYEPFLGGGALFWYLQPRKAYLSDVNKELVNTYKTLRDTPYGLIKELAQYKNTEDEYYNVRNLFRQSPKASQFIYLNKTGFNGLMRTNSKGEFNTSYGHRKSVTICDTAVLIDCALSLSGTHLKNGCYTDILDNVKAGDFIYLDPPYDESYQGYTKDKFSKTMQLSLRGFCEVLNKQGAYFMLSNAPTPLVLDMFDGYKIDKIETRYKVGGKARSRGKNYEVIIRNYS